MCLWEYANHRKTKAQQAKETQHSKRSRIEVIYSWDDWSGSSFIARRIRVLDAGAIRSRTSAITARDGVPYIKSTWRWEITRRNRHDSPHHNAEMVTVNQTKATDKKRGIHSKPSQPTPTYSFTAAKMTPQYSHVLCPQKRAFESKGGKLQGHSTLGVQQILRIF